MIVDILKEPGVLTLIGTCVSGFCAVAVAWINRNKPPRIPTVLIPIALLVGGALPGLVVGGPALARLFVPKADLEAATCGYDNCEKKSGCKCAGDQCRCAGVNELAPPKPQPTQPKKQRKPTSSLAVVLPVMAGRPWGWFMEPLRSEPLEPAL